MRFNIPAAAAFLASLNTVSASPMGERDTNDTENFKLIVSQYDSSIPSTYLAPNGSTTSDQSQAGIYTLNTTSNELSVLGKKLGILSGQNFTVFTPRDTVNYITTSFYLTNNPRNPALIWSSPEFTFAQDGVVLFGVGLSGLPAENLVYANMDGHVPSGYNQTWLIAETVIVN